MLKANKYEIIITGNPEDTEYTNGKYKPKTLVIVKGISIPKNKTALYGQNVIAKKKPSNAALNLFAWFCLF
jgi:hypothetical protein